MGKIFREKNLIFGDIIVSILNKQEEAMKTFDITGNELQ